MPGTTVAVLGGGVGGLVAVNTLRQLLPSQHRVVLVEQHLQHAFAPSFLWVMTGARRPDQVVRDLRTLASPGVDVVEAEVRGIEIAAQRVETSQQPVQYDYMVIALGADYAPEAILGLEAAHTFYTWGGATALHRALQAFPEKGGTVAVVVSAVPYKCPGAPHEGAMLLADYFRRRRGLAGKVRVDLYTPEAQPMPVAGPALGEAVAHMLERRGVTFHPQHKLVAIDGAERVLRFDGRPAAAFDLLVAIPPHRSPQVVREAGLTGETGWIPVDRATLRTRYENVHAIGDVTAISLPGRWKPDVPLVLPKAGVFAHAQALVVARRIAAAITGKPVVAEFDGNGYCMLEAGEGAAGFAFGNFFGTPAPQVQLRPMGRTWHWGKVLFEQWWLAPPGLRRTSLHLALRLGARQLGVPVVL